MANDPVVFDGVWKKFRRGERHDSLRDLIPAMVRRAVGRLAPAGLEEEEFWALQDVSFSVARGEALGIIGPNGAGKSTTLKLLTRILKPTRGSCRVAGRVGALIEVAAGFHPDLTGRENIYLQGAIMGMRRAEIDARFDEIVDFAGVGDFIDTQVKRYSSGMHARLGFAVAAHLDPDVLIIDEVLAVGDMAFQQKCVDRMKRFKRQGVTIVFVSHNLAAVAQLCERAILLSRGTVAEAGAPEPVIDRYLRTAYAASSPAAAAEFVDVRLSTPREEGAGGVAPGTPARLSCRLRFHQPCPNVTVGFVVHQSGTGIVAYGLNSASAGIRPAPADRGEEWMVSFDFLVNLTRGQYVIELHAADPATMTFFGRAMPAATFRVDEHLTPFGVADLAASCAIVQEVSCAAR